MRFHSIVSTQENTGRDFAFVLAKETLGKLPLEATRRFLLPLCGIRMTAKGSFKLYG